MSHKDLNIIRNFESADLEEFKRPDHDDFKTSAELKAEGFSGVRNNRIANTRECWVFGSLVISINQEVLASNPGLWEQEFAEYFGLHHVETERK